MTGWTSSPVSGAATHSQERSSIFAPKVWKIRLMFAFCSAKPIWMPKKPKEMFHNPQKFWRGFSVMDAPMVRGGSTRRSARAADDQLGREQRAAHRLVADSAEQRLDQPA